MQNVQNAAEIQQRVINLVELYRTKVGKESLAAKNLAEEYKHQYDNEIDFAMSLHEQGIEGYVLDIDIPKDAVDSIRANEQLLGHFYKNVAGDKADTSVLAHLLANKYDQSVFSKEEELFLEKHFREMVNYIIQTPNNDLQVVEQNDIRDLFLIPEELLELIKARFDVPAGAKVYNPFTGLAQLTALFPSCSFLCEESYISFHKRWNDYCDKCRKEAHVVYNKRDINYIWPWMKVALFANNVDATVIEDEMVPPAYDVALSFIPYVPSGIPNKENDYTGEGPDDQETINKIQLMYQNLVDGGKMLLILPNECLWKENADFSLESFWKKVIDDGSLKEIIQLPHIMGKSFRNESFSVIIIEKGNSDFETTFIDARFAALKSDSSYYGSVLNLDELNAMLQNDGIEERTGLRKKDKAPSFVIDPTLLVPQVYVTEGITSDGIPVPLTELCAISTTHVYDVTHDLPEDTPWVVENDLSGVFAGPIDISSLKKVNLPNNPQDWRYGTKRLSIFSVGEDGGSISSKDVQISLYRNCKVIDGNKDAVLFKLKDEGIVTALINASGKAIAVNPDIHVLYPTDTIDAFSLLSILSMPVVYRRLIAYSDFGLYEHFKDVLVPTDKRIVNDEMGRMNSEKEVVKNLEDSLYNIRRSMRMRKHALTQSLSSLEAMFYALNAFRERNAGHLADDDVISRIKGTTVSEAFEYISKGIKDMMPVLEHIADVEYTFAMEEWIDPEKFMEDYIARNENGWLNFKPIITWEKGNNQAKSDGYAFTNTQPSRRELALKKGQSIRQFLFPKDALEHIFKNIISNAQSWAFNDKSREDYQLKFSWHIGGEGKTLVIEIENNGTPIPEDRDTASLLEYGVSTSLHHDGHNGIGCNEIDDIMQRYDGKVEIVSTPQSTFTVKYVLTFNNIDDMGSKYKVIKPVDF